MDIKASPQRTLVLDYEHKCINVIQNLSPPGWVEVWKHVASIIREGGEDYWLRPGILSDNDMCALSYFWFDVSRETK